MDKPFKKVVWFNAALVQSGGGERLGLESVKGLIKNGEAAYYVVLDYHKEKVFDGRYHDDFIIYKRRISATAKSRSLLSHLSDVYWLRQQIKWIKPELIITQGTWGQVIYVYLATAFLQVDYSVHIFGSLFAFPPSLELTKYSIIFNKHFNEIRDSLDTYRSMVPATMPRINVLKRIKNEIYSLLKYVAVKKAREVFVLSHRNQWEVQKLYGRDSVVLKGAFPLEIFDHTPKTNIRDRLGIEEKLILLSVCRLAVNKRVDLCIQAFAELTKKLNNSVLVIGGTGPEEENLKALVKELGIESKVKFVGYIDDNDLWDFFCMCDIFVSLDLADFDIAPLEALALGKKVVWANEMEMDDIMKNVRSLFPVNPNTTDISNCILDALNVKISEDQVRECKSILSAYSWEQYAKNMLLTPSDYSKKRAANE